MKNIPLCLSLAAALILGAKMTAHAQYGAVPTSQAPITRLAPRSSAVGEEMAEERINALELRLAQLEQLLDAQKTLTARQKLADAQKLDDRLKALEARLSGVLADEMAAMPAIDAAALPAVPPAAQSSGQPPAMVTGQAADLQMRYNDMAESLRLLQGQTDRLMRQMRDLEQAMQRTGADNEFRFQALESGVRRANTGISSTSDQSEIIGFVKRAAPVAELAGASATKPASQERLVGEGDLSVLENFGQSGRVTLADPKALYERALGDLQAGNYAAAELDFADLLATHPAHELAGNAQYWLGETHYVRRQYKRAAQAFLSGYTTYEASPKAPDSLLKLGMTLNALGEKKTGCDAFAELNAKFPEAAVAVRKRAEIERKRADCGS